MPAFQQVTPVSLPNGQVIPPTVQIVNGQLQVIPTPNGMANLVITIQRSYYGSIFGGSSSSGSGSGGGGSFGSTSFGSTSFGSNRQG